ncbi:PilZ domain-containing protein [Roseateles sp. BYS180W]|uniref:Cyclic diguanosine monophosphate-binding protein n=1 Tax=Roseateles rivi TaxID=3299028 RepID=A0ABW7FR37_9BURK
MSQERRQFTRVAFEAPATLVTLQQRHSARVLDLSLKGALLALSQELVPRAGQFALVEVQLGDVRLSMAAEVAFVRDQHVGLHCRAIDLESITHLRRLIEVNLGDPKLLERELATLVGH